jgi:DNA-directed RNA polymerase specialized sigma24 family protein
MQKTSSLFDCRVSCVAEDLKNHKNEFLSDSEVNLVTFCPTFGAAVREELNATGASDNGACVAVPTHTTVNAAPFDSASRRPSVASENLHLLLDRVRDRLLDGQSDEQVLKWAQEANLPYASIQQTLKALHGLQQGTPLPIGCVTYSKRRRHSFALVSYERRPECKDIFREKEPEDVRWHYHEVPAEERYAAHFLLRAQWSSSKIVIDDMMAVLAREFDLDLLTTLLHEHRALGAKLVKKYGLHEDAEDLMQDVLVNYCGKHSSLLRDRKSAAAFVQNSLRHEASSHLRRKKVRPHLMQESLGLLTLCASPTSESANRARELIEAVKSKLSRDAQFALAYYLNETSIEDYCQAVGCSERTAYRRLVLKMEEIGRLVREEEKHSD